MEILAKRFEVAREIGRYKKLHRMPVVQATRYNDVIKSRVNTVTAMQMDKEFLKTILLAIHDESVRQQIEIINDRDR